MAKKTTKSSSENIAVKVYDQNGKAVNDVSLPSHIFNLPMNADLVHQVVTSMESSAREPIAHTKTRGEVRGGGKKPWQQKGTGRARHGSSRSPIWVGGGVAHGPRNDKNYNRKVNKKMKAKAIYTILSEKVRGGAALFIDALKLENPKTVEAKSVLAKLGTIKGYEAVSTRRNNAALILVPELTENVKLGFRNMGNVEIAETRNVNPVALLKYKYVVVANPEAAIITLDSKMK
jgi:large subunit ribosomal protein L4